MWKESVDCDEHKKSKNFSGYMVVYLNEAVIWGRKTGNVVKT